MTASVRCKEDNYISYVYGIRQRKNSSPTKAKETEKHKGESFLNCFINVYESISSVSLPEVTEGKGRTQKERVLKSYTEQGFRLCFRELSFICGAGCKNLSVQSKFTEMPRVEFSGN